MSLTRLLIKDFRNIESADLALSPGFNFLVGANGSGKTSVLEAIYTLGHGRAFRSLQIGRVIRHEQESFVLHGRLQGEARETSIGLTKDKLGDSKVRIDGTDGHKVAELALLMPMQLITPEGFTLLNGGPKYRRAFLDWGCFHNEAGFFNAWSNLKRLLKQRNAALRQVTRYAQLRPWDKELIPFCLRG
jgi:DNA replication and repair protein RecF